MRQEKTDSRLQVQYSLAQGLYWGAGCALTGFTAVFLQSRGLGNTEIGLTAGLASLASCFVSPLLSKVAARWNGISLQVYMMMYLGLSGLLYALLALLPLPDWLIMAGYGMTFCLFLAMNPFLSQISMNCIAQGLRLKFGPARGVGSISFAAAAMILAQLSSWLEPGCLGWIYAAGTACLSVVLLRMPQVYAAGDDCRQAAEADSELSVQVTGKRQGCLFGKYPLFFVLLAGFGLCYMVASCMQTYLVNILEDMHLDPSLLGISLFLMAASELPVMVLTPRIRQRMGSLPLLLAAALCYGCRNLLVAQASSFAMLLTGLMCQGISFGLFTAVITEYAGSVLEPGDRLSRAGSSAQKRAIGPGAWGQTDGAELDRHCHDRTGWYGRQPIWGDSAGYAGTAGTAAAVQCDDRCWRGNRCGRPCTGSGPAGNGRSCRHCAAAAESGLAYTGFDGEIIMEI